MDDVSQDSPDSALLDWKLHSRSCSGRGGTIIDPETLTITIAITITMNISVFVITTVDGQNRA